MFQKIDSDNENRKCQKDSSSSFFSIMPLYKKKTTNNVQEKIQFNNSSTKRCRIIQYQTESKTIHTCKLELTFPICMNDHMYV